MHYNNFDHLNALTEWLNLGVAYTVIRPGCLNFTTDSKTRIHDFANWKICRFFQKNAKCGTREFKVINSIIFIAGIFARYRSRLSIILTSIHLKVVAMYVEYTSHLGNSKTDKKIKTGCKHYVKENKIIFTKIRSIYLVKW